MRPQLTLPAGAAVMALAGLGTDTPLAASPAAAETEAKGTPAAPAANARPAADVAAVRARTNVLAGGRATVSGRIRPGVAGTRVTLQGRLRGSWRTLARSRTREAGHFALRFRPGRPGSAKLRVGVAGTSSAGAVRETVGRLNVFRRASVSWYGPGLYGNRLGCGGTLTPDRLGVAHKTLPCGTKVTLRHRGRTARVRVIDRGPFVGGREFDLTAATSRRLGFGGVGTILVTR